MIKLSPSQRVFNLESARAYATSLPGSPAAEYLEKRGLLAGARPFGLGYVETPLPGHETYKGMICIPYFRYSTSDKSSVVALRFRCIREECGVGDPDTKEDHDGHGKYNTTPGDQPRLYNTRSLQNGSDIVCITEGEFDAIAAKLAGFEAVGVPGATSWQDYFREPFLGYETVYILADGDEPGMKFGHTVAGKLGNSKVIVMPPQQDVNSFVLGFGADALRERILGK